MRSSTLAAEPEAETGSEAAERAGRDSGRVSRQARIVRLSVVAVVLVLLAWGSWRSDDDAFPVGPFVMFAFTTPPNGDVDSSAVEAIDTSGHRLPVVLDPGQVGLRRAEMEGQLPRVIAQPQLLGALAESHARLHPEQPAWQRVELVEHKVKLRDGRAVSESTDLLASWQR